MQKHFATPPSPLVSDTQSPRSVRSLKDPLKVQDLTGSSPGSVVIDDWADGADDDDDEGSI